MQLRKEDYFKNLDNRPELGELDKAYWDSENEYDINYGVEYDNTQDKLQYVDARTAVSDVRLKNLIKLILEQGIDRGASDIRIVEWSDLGVVNYKIDNKWETLRILHKSSVQPIVTAIKAQAGMNIENTTKPDIEGHISFQYGDEIIDMRGVTSRNIRSENVVLRILYPKKLNEWNIKDLGYTELENEIIKEKLNLKNGMILLSGGLGSGKTTSLMTFMMEILKESKGTKSIMEISNPLEYTIDGIVQSEISELHGYTYANGVRARKREAGDILLIGEINDPETAQVAVELGTMGQLVLGTVHSNSAIDVPLSVQNMSKGTVDVDKLGTAFRLILFQSLEPKLCPHCKIDNVLLTDEANWMKRKLGTNEVIGKISEANINGCSMCDYKGTLGMVLISELVDVNNTYKKYLRETKGNPDELKEALLKDVDSNYYPLEADVFRHLKAGNISLADAKRLIN